MPAPKKFAVARLVAGFAAPFLVAPLFASAAQLVVNNETPLDITTPPGFTYIVAGADGSLSVPTNGYLFCSNVTDGAAGTNPTPVTVKPQHGDWAMPVAQDVHTVGYNSGTLGVNRGLNTTLVCHSVGSQGEVSSPFADGILRNGAEAKTAEQYPNMINWLAPSQGFTWSDPDWSQIPTDPCSTAEGQRPAIVEDAACAAVTGLRPAGAGAFERDGKMWTGTDGVNFIYVARIDARYGAEGDVQANGMQAPVLDRSAVADSGTSAVINLVDAFDHGTVGVGGGYLGDSGQWCVLSDLPSQLNSNVCSGAIYTGSLSGTLNVPIYLSVFPPNVPRASFYAAFVRPIVGPPPTTTDPVAAVSVLLEPAVAAEGGNRFRGDDVAFGFLPTSNGFPWMSAGQ